MIQGISNSHSSSNWLSLSDLTQLLVLSSVTSQPEHVILGNENYRKGRLTEVLAKTTKRELVIVVEYDG